MLLILKKFLQDCCTARAGAYAKDAIRPLGVEEVVLILMAAHPGFHGWILLNVVAYPEHVLEPVATDGRALCVALVVRAVPGAAASYAACPTALPLRR